MPDASTAKDSGTGDDDSGPEHDADMPADMPHASIHVGVEQPRYEAILGSSVQAAITIARGKGVTGDVKVTVDDLPSGVTAAGLTIAKSKTSGQLTLTVSNDAEIAKVTRLTVLASDADANATGHLDLYVRGKPGSIDTSFGSKGVVAVPKTMTDVAKLRIVDDHILIAANASDASAHSNATVTRITKDGVLDLEFGNDGSFDFASSVAAPAPSSQIMGMRADSLGISIVGVWSQDTNTGPLLARLTPGGKLAPNHKPGPFEGFSIVSWRDIADNEGELPQTVAVGTDTEYPTINTISNDAASGETTPYSLVGTFHFVFWDPMQHVFITGGECGESACLSQLDYAGNNNTDWGLPHARNFGSGQFMDGAMDEQGRYYAVGSDHDGWLISAGITPQLPANHAADPVVHQDLGPQADRAFALALGGEYLYVAGSNQDVETSQTHIVLARYARTGVLDKTFADKGLLTFTPSMQFEGHAAVGAQSDGRVVVAGVNGAGNLLVYRVWD